jgi:uncharacterized protein
LTKLLLIIALFFVAYLLMRAIRTRAGTQRPDETRKPHSSALPEDMVRCRVCGVHLPRSESFTSRGRFFCSDEHRRLEVKEPER